MYLYKDYKNYKIAVYNQLAALKQRYNRKQKIDHPSTYICFPLNLRSGVYIYMSAWKL